MLEVYSKRGMQSMYDRANHEIQYRKLLILMVYGFAVWGSKVGIELVMRFKGSLEARDIVKGLQAGLNAVVNETEVRLRPAYPSRPSLMTRRRRT